MNFAQLPLPIIFSKQIKAAPKEEQAELRNKLIEEYRELTSSPYLHCENLKTDEIIMPSETRAILSQALMMLENKHEEPFKKKHGNMPV